MFENVIFIIYYNINQKEIMKQYSKSLYISYIGILTTLALIFSYIESLIPIPIPVPGVKLGLSNIIILFAIYYFDTVSALIIALLKVIIQALLFGSPVSFTLSLSGMILSFLILYLMKKHSSFSIVFISIMGGIFHNTGQIIAAVIMMGHYVAYYFPFLIISGLVTGTLIGFITKNILERLKKNDRIC